MAIRDKSQSAAFVYTNIYELYKKAQEAASPAITSSSRVWRADELGDLKITKFQPRTLTPAQNASSAPQPGTPPAPARANPFDDLKSNLNRLQDLHSKLRFMLKELEDLVNKK